MSQLIGRSARDREAELPRALARMRAGEEFTEPAELLAEQSELSRIRYEHQGQRRRDLATSVTSARKAVQLTPLGHPRHPLYLAVLGGALRAEHMRTGKRPVLDEALAHLRTAMDTAADDDPNRPLIAANLAMALDRRFRLTGDRADRDKAIVLSREALAAPWDDRAPNLANLGVNLRRRGEDEGRRDDLELAVVLLREALADAGPGHRHRASLLANLSLAERRTGDADNAVRHAEEAVMQAGRDRDVRPMALSNLAAALQARYEGTGHRADLDRAIDTVRRSVATSRWRDPTRVLRQAQLASILLTTFTSIGTPGALYEAVGLLRFIAWRRRGRPESAKYLIEFGRALGLVADRHLAARHVRRYYDAVVRAADAFRTAAGLTSVPASLRVQAAANWAILADDVELPSAGEGFEAYVETLALLAWPGVERAVQEQALAEWTAQIHLVAPHFIEQNKPDMAVRLLDRSRGVIWGRLLDRRSDLSRLTAVRPDLAARLTAVRAALDLAQ